MPGRADGDRVRLAPLQALEEPQLERVAVDRDDRVVDARQVVRVDLRGDADGPLRAQHPRGARLVERRVDRGGERRRVDLRARPRAGPEDLADGDPHRGVPRRLARLARDPLGERRAPAGGRGRGRGRRPRAGRARPCGRRRARAARCGGHRASTFASAAFMRTVSSPTCTTTSRSSLAPSRAFSRSSAICSVAPDRSTPAADTPWAMTSPGRGAWAGAAAAPASVVAATASDREEE